MSVQIKNKANVFECSKLVLKKKMINNNPIM